MVSFCVCYRSALRRNVLRASQEVMHSSSMNMNETCTVSIHGKSCPVFPNTVHTAQSLLRRFVIRRYPTAASIGHLPFTARLSHLTGLSPVPATITGQPATMTSLNLTFSNHPLSPSTCLTGRPSVMTGRVLSPAIQFNRPVIYQSLFITSYPLLQSSHCSVTGQRTSSEFGR